MNCDNFQLWRPIPADSKFVISGTGEDKLFNVSVGVNRNGQHEGIWRNGDVAPGPKKQVTNDDDGSAFHIFVVAAAEPPAGNPVKIDAHIEKPDGSPNPTFACRWDFKHAGQFPIVIFV